MTIGLEPSALAQGSASLSILQPMGVPVEISNDGVASASLSLYPAQPAGIALDASGYPVSSTQAPFDLDMDLTVGSVLTGLIYVNNGSSELVLGMSPQALVWLQDPSLLFSPASATEWTGFVRSDALGNGLLFFTGEWRYVRVVPEPGTAVLMLLAFAGMAGVRAVHTRNTKRRSGPQPLLRG
jgi:hypothetical protein